MNRHRTYLVVASVAALIAILTMSQPLAAQTAVFINEIHYDNADTDSGEAIEIAGPAGTDLTGWSIVLYNGSGGAAYSTTALSGVIPDLQNGFGTVFVSYPVNGIQNGSPDGVALVDATNAVVQFLSYEGTFTAVGGPADGLLSTDIGVAEGSSTPTGYSLQLTGNGSTYGDFTWAEAQPNTFGSVNAGQSFAGGPVGPTDPVVNEFVFNHVDIDTSEFAELAGDANADYSGLTLLQIEGDGTGAGVIDSVIPLGTTDANGYWTTGFLGNVFENGTVSLLLVEGFSGSAGQDLDAENDGTLDTTPWTRLVDGVAVTDGGSSDRAYADTVLVPGYDGVSFTVGGASRIPDRADTNSSSDWVRNDFDGAGLPGFVGTPDPGEALNTPGAANALVPLPMPELVINEIDYDQPSTDTAEYVEIKNVGASGTDLGGVTLELVNGNGGVVYGSYALPAMILSPGDYYVICGDAANVPNCDLDVTPDSNLVQNGAPDAVGLRYDGNLLDAVSYEGDTAAPYTEGSGVGLEDPGAVGSISRCPDGVDTDQNNVDLVFTANTPGAANDCDGGGPQEAKIHEVQGSGASVAITNLVVVEAVVVGDYQNGDQLSGFFIQEEDGDVDTDPNTSEGIFVYCGGCGTDVAVGDLVQVTGWPVDFFAMSQIDVTGAGGAVSVVSSDNPLPTPAVVDLPAAGSTRAETTFENVEGMLVTFADTLVVSEYFELARYGQLVLTADARPRQFTDANEPGVAEYGAFLDALNSRRIILDDDNNIQNDALGSTPAEDEPYFWPRPGLSNSNLIRGGDSIGNLTGVLHWSFAGSGGTDAWRVRPVEEAYTYEFASNNPRPIVPDAVGGPLKVASLNVLNYFTTINSRGADSTAELDRQREKTAAAICAMDADIVGLIEIENNGPGAIADLLDGMNGINAQCGPYEAIDTGVIGTDEIAVAFIYRPATVSTVGNPAILDDPAFVNPFAAPEDRNRPALAQTFDQVADGARLTVVVNHLKSKSGSELDDPGAICVDPDPGNDIPDCDQGDGQSYFNPTRAAAAQVLVDWLATDPTGSGDGDVLIIGDLNAYRNEDPIDVVKVGPDDLPGTADDYVNLLDWLIGSSAYTYLFDGQLGYLDHALANGSLLGQVTGVTPWHINADEIPVFDYNDEILDVGNESSFERESTSLPIYEPNAYRASDHDPVIVGLDLNGPPVCSAAYASPDTLWSPNHQMEPVEVLGVTDPEGDGFTIVVDSIYQDEPVNGTGDGDAAPDGEGLGTATAWVRAERAGSGNGRVYHIAFTATDTFGNSCSGVVLVGVPKSQGSQGAAVDDGPLYDSTLVP